MMIQAGVARQNITPPIGVPLVGYGHRLGGNRGVHDPLFATALVLQQDDGRVALVSLDALMISQVTHARVQAQVEPHLLLCCSHTHSGPPTHTAPNSPPTFRWYLDWLVRQIVAAIREAQTTLRPTRVFHTLGATKIGVNRRSRSAHGGVRLAPNPDGPVDRSVQVLQFIKEDDTPLATIANMACHGTTLLGNNRLVTADWPGVMRAEVEKQTGAPLLFVQGNTADVNPAGDAKFAKGYAGCEHAGRAAAADVLAALANIQAIHAAPLRSAHTHIPLPLEKRTNSVLGWLRAVPGITDNPVVNGIFPWHIPQITRDGTPHAQLRADAVRLGDLALVTMGAEIFTETGLTIKQASPAQATLFGGVTNGCAAYLPTEAEHALGGYEVDVAPFLFGLSGRYRADAASIAAREVSALVARLF